MKLLNLILVLLFMSCKSNQANRETLKTDCSEFNDKYVEYVMDNEKDSALYYIDKAILCDPKDNFFKAEKIKLLLKYNDYSSAIDIAKSIAKENDPTYKMLYGVLLLRQNSTDANNVLKESYNLLLEEVKNYNKDNSNLHFYKIGLDNYFQGKKYSLEMVERFRNNYNEEHHIQLANLIESLILNHSGENLLFKLFNIENQ